MDTTYRRKRKRKWPSLLFLVSFVLGSTQASFGWGDDAEVGMLLEKAAQARGIKKEGQNGPFYHLNDLIREDNIKRSEGAYDFIPVPSGNEYDKQKSSSFEAQRSSTESQDEDQELGLAGIDQSAKDDDDEFAILELTDELEEEEPILGGGGAAKGGKPAVSKQVEIGQGVNHKKSSIIEENAVAPAKTLPILKKRLEGGAKEMIAGHEVSSFEKETPAVDLNDASIPGVEKEKRLEESAIMGKSPPPQQDGNQSSTAVLTNVPPANTHQASRQVASENDQHGCESTDLEKRSLEARRRESEELASMAQVVDLPVEGAVFAEAESLAKEEAEAYRRSPLIVEEPYISQGAFTDKDDTLEVYASSPIQRPTEVTLPRILPGAKIPKMQTSHLPNAYPNGHRSQSAEDLHDPEYSDRVDRQQSAVEQPSIRPRAVVKADSDKTSEMTSATVIPTTVKTAAVVSSTTEKTSEVATTEMAGDPRDRVFVVVSEAARHIIADRRKSQGKPLSAAASSTDTIVVKEKTAKAEIPVIIQPPVQPISLYNPQSAVDKRISAITLYVLFGFCAGCVLAIIVAFAFSTLVPSFKAVAVVVLAEQGANAALSARTTVDSVPGSPESWPARIDIL